MDIRIDYSSGRIESYPVGEQLTEINIQPTGKESSVSASVQIPLIDVFSCWHSALTPGLTNRIPWVEKVPCGAQTIPHCGKELWCGLATNAEVGPMVRSYQGPTYA